ncbi:glyoxalase bleomycin resistance dioxygenase [Trichoderma arundinaceum]|uniref:Glyoxalase bleomycin resistance dioxygenase n=1 Tax=Trichoderma arundinaceum TaxID=490622 RepID=A0A395NAX5_TRIAR|nr:glyoxalase bleomycin resistance dioxygenase [Trichoderma arundinaceum]
MSSTEESYGQICWLTVPVVDIDRARAFYADIFSWETSPDGVPNSRPGVKELYFFSRGQTLHGAFYVMEDGFHVTNHSIGSQDAISVHPSFNVRNCKDTLALVEKHGGKTHLWVDSPPPFSSTILRAP